MFEARQLFFDCLAVCYFSSFVSYFAQIEGLYGDLGGLVEADVSGAPLVRALASVAHMRVDATLQLLSALGTVVAAWVAVSRRARNVVALAVLLGCHVSIVQAGGIFSSFQWDQLLSEAGLLALFWTVPSRSVRFALSLLLFRLMFSSGAVKLAAEEHGHWWRLSAVTVHLETTCLPSFGSWLFRQLPATVHVASCAIMFVTELLAPWFVFVPTRTLATVNVVAQVALQLAIMATGNYNYFNILTIAIAVACLDDEGWLDRSSSSAFVSAAVLTCSAGAVALVWANPWLWSHETLRAHLGHAVQAASVLAVAQLPVHVWLDLRTAMASKSALSLIRTALTTTAVCALVLASLTPFSLRLDRATTALLPRPVVELGRFAAAHRLVSSYGLFASLTTERDEILLEGTSDGATWFDIKLPFKPSGPHDAKFVLPFHPRLDWQMWFAALQGPRWSPFVLRLAQRLLDSRTFHSVATLLDESVDRLPVPHRVRITTRRFQLTTDWHAASVWTIGAPRAFVDGVPEFDASSLARILPATRVPDANDGKVHLVPLGRTLTKWLIVSPWLLMVVMAQRKWGGGAQEAAKQKFD